MNLGFKEYYPFDKKRPTDFQEKIAKGIKLHTLREDKKDVFKVGSQLHMATGIRTKKYFCFDDTKGVVSKQKILIVYYPAKHGLAISVNRKKMKPEQIRMLIANDGFDTRNDFINWFFPEDKNGKCKRTIWSGNIIHWTSYKY